MIIYRLRQSKKSNCYWVATHVPDTVPSEEQNDGEVSEEFLSLLPDPSAEDAFEEVFFKDELEKTLLRAGLGELSVKIAFALMDGYTRADIARRFSLPYNKVDYLYRKIKRVLRQHFFCRQR
jgi:DNA-directed RNA polymerase specialized sigma24 family protein